MYEVCGEEVKSCVRAKDEGLGFRRSSSGAWWIIPHLFCYLLWPNVPTPAGQPVIHLHVTRNLNTCHNVSCLCAACTQVAVSLQGVFLLLLTCSVSVRVEATCCSKK